MPSSRFLLGEEGKGSGKWKKEIDPSCGLFVYTNEDSDISYYRPRFILGVVVRTSPTFSRSETGSGTYIA